jgi:hypothetical protein
MGKSGQQQKEKKRQKKTKKVRKNCLMGQSGANQGRAGTCSNVAYGFARFPLLIKDEGMIHLFTAIQDAKRRVASSSSSSSSEDEDDRLMRAMAKVERIKDPVRKAALEKKLESQLGRIASMAAAGKKPVAGASQAAQPWAATVKKHGIQPALTSKEELVARQRRMMRFVQEEGDGSEKDVSAGCDHGTFGSTLRCDIHGYSMRSLGLPAGMQTVI